MSRLLIAVFFLFSINSVYGQCPTWPNSVDCNTLNATGGVCNSNTVFCIGDSVGVQNTSTGSIDSSFICWDDGSPIQKFAGVFTGCVKHFYNYKPDSCVGGNGQIQKQIRIGIKKSCPSGESFHYVSTPIDIKFKPHADISVSPIIACLGVPVIITNTSCPNTNNPTHLWDFGDGSTSSSQYPSSHTYNTPGTYTITYTVTNSCGSSTQSKTVTVLPPTTVNPITQLIDYCSPSNFTPDVNSNNVLTFLWTSSPMSGINISLPTDSQPFFQINSAGIYNIQLNVTGCCNSPGSDCTWDTTMTILQGPNVTSNPIPTFCGNAVLNPSTYISATGSISQYNWSFPGGIPNSSSSQNPGNISFNSSGNYPITLVVISSCGNDTLTDTVRVLPPTIIQPLLNYTGNCTPLQIAGNLNPSNATSYLWGMSPSSNGIISAPSNSNTNITINTPGIVTITANANGCCTAPLSDCTWDTTLTILQGPNVSLNAIPTFCGSAFITPTNYFSAQGNISQFNWSFPGGSPSSSTNSNPGNVTYNTPGNYAITLSVLNNCGVASITDTIRILPPTIIQPQLNLTGLCTPLQITGNMNPSNTQTISWNLNPTTNGVIVSPSLAQTQITLTTAGSTTISASASGCCTSPLSICNWDTTLNVLQGPILNATPIPDFCNSANVNIGQYFSFGGAISTYQWDFTGGSPATSNSANPGSVIYNSPGNYQITLIATGSCGADTVTNNLLVGAPPLININPTDIFGCDSLTVNYINNSPLLQSYSWVANNGVYIGGTNNISISPSIFYSTPGFYSVNVTASSPGCSPISNNFNVTIGEAPHLSQIATIDDICDTISLNLNNYFNLSPSTSDSGYLWTITYNGNILFNYSGNNPVPIIIQDTGTYAVYVLAWNACDSIILIDTFRFNLPSTLILPNDTTVCKGSGPIPLIAIPSNGNWTWNGNTITTGNFITSLTNQVVNQMIYSYGVATCAVSDSFNITVLGANINAGPDTTICSNSSLFSLNAIPIGGTWSGGGIINQSSGLYNPALPLTSVDTIVYTFVDSVYNCIVKDTLLVTIFRPTASATSFPDTACINQPILFSNNATGTTSVWNLGDGSAINNLNSFTHTYISSGPFTVTLIYENQYGCRDTSIGVIEIVEPPNSLFSLDTNRGCAVLPITISNLSSFYGGNSYSWDYGNAGTDSTFNPGIVFFDQGPGDSTIYYITLTVANGCGVAIHTDSIVVYPIPVPDFGMVYNDSCSPALVSFNNITTGQPQSFEWFINGVSVSIDSILPPNVFIADSADSTYIITLVASNRCGTDSISKSLTVRPNEVTAFFNTDHIFGCRPLNVTFTSAVAASSIINWDFGDGNTASGEIVTHTYDTAGIFIIWQYVDNLCGFDSVSQVIEVLPQPELSFLIPPKSCDNDIVSIINTSPNISGYSWDFGDLTSLDSIQYSPTHLFSTPGQYTVTLIGFADNTGCSDTLSQLINIVGHPIADFNLSTTSGCVPLQLTLTSTSLNASYYLWSMGNTDTLIGNPSSYIYLDSGQYAINLTVIDTNLCRDDSTYYFITAFPIPSAEFTYSQQPNCSIPTFVSFTNNSIGANSYQWDMGIFGQSSTANPVVPFNSSSSFTCTLVAINSYNCKDTIQKLIKIYDNPIANFTPKDTTGCVPFSLSFINTSLNANGGIWSFGNGDSSYQYSPIYTFNTTGSYSITLIANMDSICFDTITVSNAVNVLPIPKAEFNFSQIIDTLVNPSGIYSFTDLSIDAVTWLWDFGDNSALDTNQNPLHRFENNGVFYVTLTVFNEEGCPDTITKIVVVDYLSSLFIPNAFSPDAGTPETKYFIPKGAGISEYTIEVFSPYGEKVWASNALTNGHPSEYWDGSLNGTTLPQGAYVWKAHAIFQNGSIWNGMIYNGEKPIKVGSVMIIR